MARNTRIIRAVVTEGVDGYTVMVWLRSDEARFCWRTDLW